MEVLYTPYEKYQVAFFIWSVKGDSQDLPWLLYSDNTGLLIGPQVIKFDDWDNHLTILQISLTTGKYKGYIILQIKAKLMFSSFFDMTCLMTAKFLISDWK